MNSKNEQIMGRHGTELKNKFLFLIFTFFSAAFDVEKYQK